MSKKRLKQLAVVNHDPSNLAVIADQEKLREQRAIYRFENNKRDLVSLSDQLAGTKDCFKNWKIPQAEKYFPIDVSARFISKYYPYTNKSSAVKGEPLAVDEPRTEQETERSYDKQRILKQMGIKCVVIEQDSRLDNCLDQLGLI